MKKLFKTFAVLVLTGTMAFATGPVPQSFKVGMYNVENSHVLKVFVDKESKDALLLKIKDQSGRVIQREYFGKNMLKTGVILNMENLKNGNYTILISHKDSVYEKEIEIKTETTKEHKIVI